MTRARYEALRRRFDDGQDLTIASLYRDGETLSHIAREYSASISAVQRSLVRSGVERRSFSRIRSTPLTVDQEAEILARFLDGFPFSGLCKEYRIGRLRLNAMAERAGHNPRKVIGKDPITTRGEGGAVLQTDGGISA